MVLVALVAYAVVGSLLVRSRGDAEATLSERFIDMNALALQCEGGTVTIEGENKVSIAWDEGAEARLVAASEPMPIAAAQCRAVQLDIYIGGKMNSQGHARTGYRVWLELQLLNRAGEVISSERIEAPLESEKERERLYSLIAAAAEPAMWRMALTIEAEQAVMPAGYVTCSFAEVLFK